jgi:hypothetical protein
LQMATFIMHSQVKALIITIDDSKN